VVIPCSGLQTEFRRAREAVTLRRRTLCWFSKPGSHESPKTERSRRNVSISEFLTFEISEHRSALPERRPGLHGPQRRPNQKADVLPARLETCAPGRRGSRSLWPFGSATPRRAWSRNTTWDRSTEPTRRSRPSTRRSTLGTLRHVCGTPTIDLIVGPLIAVDLAILGADDGIRTRDPHLGKAIGLILRRPADSRSVRLCR
jgi:hypothetical protein